MLFCLLWVARVEGQGGHLSLTHTAARQTICRASYPLLTPLGSAHLQSPDPEPALLCCPLEVQGLLSQGLQQVRSRDSSLVLMTPGPGLLPCPGERWNQFVQLSDINMSWGSIPNQGCLPGLWKLQIPAAVGPLTQIWPLVAA